MRITYKATRGRDSMTKMKEKKSRYTEVGRWVSGFRYEQRNPLDADVPLVI